jgi:hypothetical protein
MYSASVRSYAKIGPYLYTVTIRRRFILYRPFKHPGVGFILVIVSGLCLNITAKFFELKPDNAIYFSPAFFYRRGNFLAVLKSKGCPGSHQPRDNSNTDMAESAE